MSRLIRYLSSVAAALCGTLPDPAAALPQRQSYHIDLAQVCGAGYHLCYGQFSRAAKEHNNLAMTAFYRERRMHRKGRMPNTLVDFRWVQQ